MTDAQKGTEKTTRKRKTLEDKISEHQLKLQKLQNKQKRLQQESSEKNKKALLNLLKTEELDSVSIDIWQAALPSIKTLLTTKKQDQPSVKVTDQPVKTPQLSEDKKKELPRNTATPDSPKSKQITTKPGTKK